MSRLEVEVEYPSAGAENMTGSLHLWVLRTEEGRVDAGRAACGALVARSTDPYAPDFELLVDQVFLLPDEPAPTVEEVPRGRVLVYLEAVDFAGEVLLAGCQEVELSGEAQTVVLRMSGPGTFDCSDPGVEDGAPCDDGMLCTTGETCQGGACSGGTARDCSFLADSCNGATCEEGTGCVKEPLPNGTSCDDGMFCSSGDVCMDGLCVGAQRDCSSSSGACTVGVCNEGFDRCEADPLPNGTDCDDGQFCTVSNFCSSGSCTGSARDCSGVEDQCNASSCNESTDQCDKVPLTGNSCNDAQFCTVSDACSSGSCTGSPRDCSGVEDQCNASTCNESTDQCEKDPLTGPSCDDGDACTENDTCQDGTCTGDPLDGDNDGFVAAACGGEDCDDGDETVNPDQTEGSEASTCSDNVDNDCDGDVDGDDDGCL